MNREERIWLIEEKYEGINRQWMAFHVNLLTAFGVVCASVEILVFFILYGTGALIISPWLYGIKYILVPGGLMLVTILAARSTVKSRKYSDHFKRKMVSLLFLCMTLVLASVHSGLVSALVVGIFPILLTVMYEDEKLLGEISIVSVLLLLVSGFFIFWDKDKYLTVEYALNTIILAVAVFAAWMACRKMIQFLKRKKEVFIQGELENYQLKDEVLQDSLTRVGSRQALSGYLKEIARSGESRHCLAMLDIDAFKKINDTCGHIAGDEVLHRMGEVFRRMPECVRVFRYGGDEFCLIFQDRTLEQARGLLEQVQEEITEQIRIPGWEGRVSTSAGLTQYRKEESPEMFLQRADQALYEAKRISGNQIRLV